MNDLELVIKQLINYYKELDNLLLTEQNSLIDFDVQKYKEIVNEKIELLTTITNYEQERVLTYGEVTLLELLDNQIKKDSSYNIYKNDITNLVNTINEKIKTNEMLSGKMSEYSKVVINALKGNGKEKATYGKNGKFDEKENAMSILNKSI